MTIGAHGIVLRTTGGEDGPAQAVPTRLEEMPMTFQSLYRPSGRSVWLGKDIVQTDDWIVRLSPATIEEIDASVSRFQGRNAYDTPGAREEIPLPTMAKNPPRRSREMPTRPGSCAVTGIPR